MIPEASTHLIISEAVEELLPNEALSIETYAEGLMDDLFTDIDNILDARRKRPAKAVRAEYVPVQTVTVKMPEVVLPQTVHRAVQAMSPVKSQQTSTLVFNAPSVNAITKKTEQNRGGLTNLLILGATLSAAMVATLYLTESELINKLTDKLIPQTLQTSQVQTPVVPQPDPQAELVNYMLEALAVIDQQSNTPTPPKSGFPDVNLSQANSLALPNTQPVGTLPPPVAANNVSPAPSRVTNVVERIYIPVYQAPPPVNPLPQVPPVPAQLSAPQASAPQAVKDTSKNTQVVTKPIPAKSLPAAVKQANNSLVPRIAPPKLPTATTSVPATRPEPATTAIQQVYLPTYSAELEGLLELGSKSAALFKVDGVTRRINLGENIGATGWNLVEVSNGEAIIRRNGEVRSIYAGQKL
ncbi:hypothetical protein A0J48_001385 [Sphaerospermopsis aphanizomenoides BCCUSP55]|nr:hypothetical protein [Sphaerospermopsis aphanizomenoides BCCUSP55]